MSAAHLLQEFVSAVRQTTGATHVSIMLHGEPLDRATMMLQAGGPGAAVPELADEESAWTLATTVMPDAASVPALAPVPGADPACTLLRFAFSDILGRPQAARRAVDERRDQPDISAAPPVDGTLWIGLRDAGSAASLSDELRTGTLALVCLRLTWALYHYAGLERDTVTGLPGRTQLRVFLRRVIAAARTSQQPIAVMLVNPDDFAVINYRHGRRHGDDALHKAAQLLRQHFRSTDGIFHYGGAVFAVVLPATDAVQCRAAAQKLRRHLADCRFVDDSVALTFSMGAAVASAKDLERHPEIEEQVSHRADAALNAAKLAGGARIVVAGIEDGEYESGALLNPLTGIFAADTEKDYRNMLLLWETVALISTQAVPDRIACDFVDRIAIGFRPDRAALFSFEESNVVMLASSVRDEAAADGRVTGRRVDLDERSARLVREALESGKPGRSLRRDSGQAGFTAYAVPLVARGNTLACLYMDARCKRLQLASSDMVFLNALATQMAVAMDRAELAARWISDKERESRLLREEVRELRQAIHQTKLVFHSQAMHAVMKTLRKVAPSDATVLIVGESGTGKEMLAKTVHDFSNRREAPFVIFDCGAVATNLLEAELFGHTKGAFTGAQTASAGLIAQADGGTLFLDEIGELPLDVQAKLLRFVQEKEYSQLGSAESRKVDVRIVAATNRELQDEVGAGRFRADLYYRLRVIAVQAVPLRQRTDDIMPLARYFQEKFSSQYQMAPKRFSHQAEQKLLQYRWPGNVRELQNCVLRAVLTHEAELIDADAIELFPESGSETEAPANAHADQARKTTAAPAKQHIDSALAADNPWPALAVELERQVANAMVQQPRRPVPIGRWLADDLVMAASARCSNVVRQAAQLVGVPDSTFRRHLEKASASADAGHNRRPESWAPVRGLVRRVIEHASLATEPQGNLLDRARDLLLGCVHDEIAGESGPGAALMGITPPTFKRWIEAKGQQP